MAECKYCGKQIIFKQITLQFGRTCWVPANLDGSRHNDFRTREWTADAIARENHGSRRITGLSMEWVGCGDVLPWDFSLGDFRDFTAAEKAEGLVCRRL